MQSQKTEQLLCIEQNFGTAFLRRMSISVQLQLKLISLFIEWRTYRLKYCIKDELNRIKMKKRFNEKS